MLSLYKSFDSSQLEYSVQFTAPCFRNDFKTVEKLQENWLGIITNMKDFSCSTSCRGESWRYDRGNIDHDRLWYSFITFYPQVGKLVVRWHLEEKEEKEDENSRHYDLECAACRTVEAGLAAILKGNWMWFQKKHNLQD